MSPIAIPPGPRKRTNSFSSQRPSKSVKMTPSLRRSPSFVSIPSIDLQSEILLDDDDDDENSNTSTPLTSFPSSSVRTDAHIPYNRTLRYYKEQRERRKALRRQNLVDDPPHFTVHIPTPIRPTTPAITTTVSTCPRGLPSSPLVPPTSRTVHQPHPLRSSFPRTKPKQDLYKVAITTRMRTSPNGIKILTLGPRLALAVLTATMELEKIVADQDVAMDDLASTALSNSWVVVPGEDWEMLECAA